MTSAFYAKYTPYRIAITAVNTLLLVSIALTALSGMSMSGHAVPFMYGLINVMTARELHLAMSYWSFILMGIHIGLHMKAMTAKLPDKGKIVFKSVLTGVSGGRTAAVPEKRYRELHHLQDSLRVSRLHCGKVDHHSAELCNAVVFCADWVCSFGGHAEEQGSGTGLQTTTVCPPKPSGSMPAVQERSHPLTRNIRSVPKK
jgi:hypothetical protein